MSADGGAPRLDWREIVNAKTLALVPDWFADIPPYQRARVRWAFQDPTGKPNEPNLVADSKYEALALRYTSLPKGATERPRGGYGSLAHGLKMLPADKLAATAPDEQWVLASSVEKRPLHELYTKDAHSESRIQPPPNGEFMRHWAEANMLSASARFSLPPAPDPPLSVSFISPVSKLFASILAPSAVPRLERWASGADGSAKATVHQRDAFMEALYSLLATIDRMHGQTSYRRDFRKPELIRVPSAKPPVAEYRPTAKSAVPPAQKHMERVRRQEHAALIAMAEQAMAEGRVLAGNGGEAVRHAISAAPFKSNAKPIGGVRVGALESSAQAMNNAFTLQDRKNYAGKALATNASEWARTTASFGRIVGDAPWHGDGMPPGSLIPSAARLQTRPIVRTQLQAQALEGARARRPAHAAGNVHGYAQPA